MSSKFWAGLFLCASLSVASRSAVAQNGSSNNFDFSFTGIKIGIVVGAVAVGGLVVYLVIPKQKTIEGCVESASGMTVLTNEKDHRPYELISDVVVIRPGQRLKLKGKKRKDKSGAWQLRVKKFVRDDGACGTQSIVRVPEH